MDARPVAAGKSSFGHIDQDLALANIVKDTPATYLDLACGAGNYTLALAGRVAPGSTIYALDLWDEGIAMLQEAAKQQDRAVIRAMRADMTQPLPLADGSVDVCLMATVLHDLPERRGQTLAEVKRVLAPGGAVVVIEFKKLDRGPGPGKERRLGPEDSETLFAAYGFAAEAPLDLGEFTYLIRFTAKA